MKRKLDENDAPIEVKGDSDEHTFGDLGLDPRLLQAISHQGFKKPTLVQSKTIPLALDGVDILAKAKTGSGKTAAYVLPVLQAILKRKQSSSESYTAALILVPTRELADQVTKSIESFSVFCTKEIQVVKLSDTVSDAVQRSLLSAAPDIVVSTPAKVWHHIKNSALSVDNVRQIVLDEADLVLSYGYEEDLQSIAASLPKGVQMILTSATLTTEVGTLKKLFCQNAIFLDLAEPEAEGEGVSQYAVKCGEDEKFLLTYILFKLRLITGKAIIFVADTDRCYRLKLFLGQFGVRSCILNPELPVSSRIHVVEEFNRNVYDIIIASDDNEVLGDEDNEDGTDAKAKDKTQAPKTSGKARGDAPFKKKRKHSRNNEYGVSRGIDFKNVRTVINFDLPTTSKSYQHRIGRTARAGQTGMSLSFVIPKAKFRKHIPTSIETAENDEKVLARIRKSQAKQGKEVKDYSFDMKQVDAFRYRMNDALRAVTRVAIREARTRELREELLKSEKLTRFFEDNPSELHHLRHDGELKPARTNAHLRHVPDYLLPSEGKKALTTNDVGFVPFKNLNGRSRKSKGRGRRVGSRKVDPLKSLKARPKKI